MDKIKHLLDKIMFYTIRLPYWLIYSNWHVVKITWFTMRLVNENDWKFIINNQVYRKVTTRYMLRRINEGVNDKIIAILLASEIEDFINMLKYRVVEYF